MHSSYFHFTRFCAFLLIVFSLASCKKYLDIPGPGDELDAETVFSNDNTAEAAVAGLYASMYATNTFTFKLRLIAGHSADETASLQGSTYNQFRNNALSTGNNDVWSPWMNCYAIIYQANAIIEGLEASTGVSATMKSQLTGEAKFVRAVCYFYLVNLYGNVPLVKTTDVSKSALAPRTPVDEVYESVVEDLEAAKSLLAEDYSYSGGERTRASKWAATAMLARVQLYRQHWEEAEENASLLIKKKDMYTLLPDCNDVFLANSREAIWQFNTTGSEPNDGFSYEGIIYIFGNPDVPTYVLTDQLAGAFEAGDVRKSKWTRAQVYNNKTYYYAQKYKLSEPPAGSEGKEYQMVLRLAEQYLIRAEARAQLGNIPGAQDDIDSVRLRASLPATTASDKAALLLAIEQERRVELFFEYGHRWFDLKRTGRADAVLGAVKPSWKTDAALYPVPQKAISANPNLLPNNKGY